MSIFKIFGLFSLVSHVQSKIVIWQQHRNCDFASMIAICTLWEPLTTVDVTTANVATANVTTADVTTANVTAADYNNYYSSLFQFA